MSDQSGKVLAYVLKGYPRLSETFILNEMLLLEQQGQRIHIYALRNPGESKVHSNVELIKAPVRYIPDSFWRSFGSLVGANILLFCDRPKTYWKSFREAAVRSLARRSSSTIKRFVQAGYLVQKYLRNDPAAHIHAHFAHGPCTTALYAAALTGTQYSFTAHAKDIYVQEEEFLRTKLERAKFVVTCTGFNRRTLQHVHDGTPIHRIYHGVDCSRFQERTESLSHDVPRILSVGRLVPKKGFPVLIEALALLAERGFAFHCTIVGDGPEKKSLERMIDRLGLAERVEFTGKLTQEEVIRHYAEADCISLACQVQEDGDRDGIPNVLVEAMAMGVPVISTRISGIPELVEDEVTGLLVEPGDPTALASAIERVLCDASLAQRLSESGRLRVTEEHDSTTNTRLLGLVFEDSLREADTEQHETCIGANPALAAGTHRG